LLPYNYLIDINIYPWWVLLSSHCLLCVNPLDHVHERLFFTNLSSGRSLPWKWQQSWIFTCFSIYK